MDCCATVNCDDYQLVTIKKTNRSALLLSFPPALLPFDVPLRVPRIPLHFVSCIPLLDWQWLRSHLEISEDQQGPPAGVASTRCMPCHECMERLFGL